MPVQVGHALQELKQYDLYIEGGLVHDLLMQCERHERGAQIAK